MTASSPSRCHIASLRGSPSSPSHGRPLPIRYHLLAASPAPLAVTFSPLKLRSCRPMYHPRVSDRYSDCRVSLDEILPIEAVLFDIDGTLCDSDPIHYFAFREMLQEVGYNNGNPITEEFFSKNISGGHNDNLARFLFPDWDFKKAMQFMDDKEAMFRRIAADKLEPVQGLQKLCKWIENRQLKRAAVTNAPRANAELMISILGLTDFFQVLVVGSECEKAKPFPDPYLKALELIRASADHTFIFEDSVSGIKAGVAAGMPVIGMKTRNPEELLLNAGAAFLIRDFEDQKLWKTLEEDEWRASATKRT